MSASLKNCLRDNLELFARCSYLHFRSHFVTLSRPNARFDLLTFAVFDDMIIKMQIRPWTRITLREVGFRSDQVERFGQTLAVDCEPFEEKSICSKYMPSRTFSVFCIDAFHCFRSRTCNLFASDRFEMLRCCNRRRHKVTDSAPDARPEVERKHCAVCSLLRLRWRTTSVQLI
jgi:hypothetical protein